VPSPPICQIALVFDPFFAPFGTNAPFDRLIKMGNISSDGNSNQATIEICQQQQQTCGLF
jgi:hypothetical protein